ncbi:hypothetical protein BD410DRAFT_786194 [Rickenella mellea]|uniref:DUF6534 domain-containing protein n=1 Tax=Rickenella mellea TaxID=50990 RepID=A0A4Y7QBQ2_9AGAM|nr:hypothetical protein BD410DRAFT_786194 [Rickenella mellea]
MDAPPAPVVIDLSLTYGPLLIGNLIGVAFWGAQCIQTVYYFVNYPKDSTLLKTWVMVLWGLDTAHVIICVKGIWFQLIRHYGDYVSLGNIRPELIYQLMITGIVAFMAQCYLARRIFIFGTKTVFKWAIPVILAPLIAFQLVGLMIYAGRGLTYKTTDQLAVEMNLAIGINSASTAVDVIITLAMCTLLYRSRNGLASTDRLLGRLMISSLNTGAWTALFATASIILVTTHPNDLLYSLTYIPICALYCNTILGNLTSRSFFRKAANLHGAQLPLDTISFPFPTSSHSQTTEQTTSKLHTLNSISEDPSQPDLSTGKNSDEHAV